MRGEGGEGGRGGGDLFVEFAVAVRKEGEVVQGGRGGQGSAMAAGGRGGGLGWESGRGA